MTAPSSARGGAGATKNRQNIFITTWAAQAVALEWSPGPDGHPSGQVALQEEEKRRRRRRGRKSEEANEMRKKQKQLSSRLIYARLKHLTKILRNTNKGEEGCR